MAQSQCDRAEQQQLALTVMPRMALTTSWVIPAPHFAFVPYTELRLSPLSRAIVPHTPPPRDSFRLG